MHLPASLSTPVLPPCCPRFPAPAHTYAYYGAVVTPNFREPQ